MIIAQEAQRQKKRKYKKKTERQSLDKKCLDLFSQIVRERDKVCQICGHDGSFFQLQAHHIVPRAWKLSRYLPENGICLCTKCHGIEKNPTYYEVFRQNVVNIVGEDKYKSMHKAYRVQHKWSLPDLRDIYNELKEGERYYD